MLTKNDILQLLEQLETCVADDLESQYLDFKQWNERSFDDNIKTMLKMSVCMANGDGGSVVFGVADRVLGKKNAIKGVPVDLDLATIQKRIYERTDPHLTPVVEEVIVEEQKRLLLITVYPGIPPYTTTDGSATIRKGKDCIPYTGSLRREMLDQSIEMDYTAELIYENWKELLSHSAMEKVREIMIKERVDDDLVKLSDEELLHSIGALKNGFLTKGALLLVGKPESIAQYIPQHRWSYRKMLSETDYSLRDDGTQSIPIALYELERYISVDNPVVTIESGLVHPEFSTYPQIALRESLLNAFGHRDYRMTGTIMLKQYNDKLVLTNPGNFIGGITPNNILHHPPVTRNNHLMDLLDRLKLVNRSNLGVSRIFRSLLIEGKEPPIYREVGANVELTFISSPLNKSFKSLVSGLTEKGYSIDVDHLLILQHLMRHEEIDTLVAAEVTQRNVEQARELLSKMHHHFDLLESIGRGKGRYFRLSRSSYNFLAKNMKYERSLPLDMEAIKMRILTLLKNEKLTNKEIRNMTGLNTKQVYRLIKDLEDDGVIIEGIGAGTKYVLDNHKYEE